MRNKKIEVKGNMYCAGVYCFKNRDGKVLYVGSALECNDALSRHLYNLKRGYYADNNKRLLQLAFDRDDLYFEILVVVSNADKVRAMTNEDKQVCQNVLSQLEEEYIDKYKDSICNKQMRVTKHSSNKNRVSTYKRRMANVGAKNPNCKYTEDIISNVLWFKVNGYKPKEICKIMSKIGVDINASYVSAIGLSKWVFTEPRLTISADILLENKAN